MKQIESLKRSGLSISSPTQNQLGSGDKGWGYLLLVAMAGATAAGGFVMDMNKTHIFNPKWTPHSKFHNAISIMNGAILGAAGLYFLLGKHKENEMALKLGAALPGMFWSSLIAAPLFPGAKGMEAEFPDKVPKIGNTRITESAAASLNSLLLAIGYLNARKK
jgi:hypothetical protein